MLENVLAPGGLRRGGFGRGTGFIRSVPSRRCVESCGALIGCEGIGPFWVPTTLIFSLFLTSSLTASISAYLSGETYNYDFTRLGAAVTLVSVLLSLSSLFSSNSTISIDPSNFRIDEYGMNRYAYFLGLPILVWAALKYWARVSERTMVEIISVYGYAATIWILTSVRPLPPPFASVTFLDYFTFLDHFAFLDY